MAPAENPPEGPLLETYLETRLNLLTASIDKLEASLRERIDAVEEASVARKDHLSSEINHAKQLLAAEQDKLKVQSDRSEKTQHDINIASNEWRATLTDFRGSVPTKDEMNRFYAEFGAYKLENEKRMAAATASALATSAAKNENKDDWKSIAALIIAIGAAALAYFAKHP